MSPNPSSEKVTDFIAVIIDDLINEKNYKSNDLLYQKFENLIITENVHIDIERSQINSEKVQINSENVEINSEKAQSIDYSALKTLSLISRQLTFLPTKFVHLLTNLTSLDLSDNKIEELPYSFDKLSKLEQFAVNNNQLDYLPQSFCELKYLKSLSLRSNKLKVLPDQFGNLVNLETLDLSHNEIEFLPISCSKLNKVSKLLINQNKIPELPDCVTNGMKNLHVLDISDNKFILMNKAPASIHLTKFIARNNDDCSYFPQWILWVKYNKLREVNLDSTTFKRYSYPTEQMALQITKFSMKQANLSDRSIQNIVANMVRIELLDLSNDSTTARNVNNFWHTPFEQMRTVNTLKELRLRGTFLPILSGTIQNLCNLVVIDLSYTCINWLPNEFTNLKNLEIIRIEHSKIILLPEDIGKIKKLRELWASNNTISELPNSLFELKNLKTLDLFENHLFEISDRFEEMDSLQQLDLERNFCDVVIKVKDGDYDTLKSSLRQSIGNTRMDGVKVQSEYYSDEEKFVYSQHSYSDDTSSISDDKEYAPEESAVEMPPVSPINLSESAELENWDDSDPTDNFEPRDSGCFRTLSNYHEYESFNGNYYCPADYHEKPIFQLIAERNLLKYSVQEEGQFDDV